MSVEAPPGTEARWEEPATIEEARARANELLYRSDEIRAQLAERRDDRDPDTLEWRPRAKSALNHKVAEYRWLKDWIRTHGSARLHEPGRGGRETDVGKDVVKAMRLISGAVGRMTNLYEAAVALIDDDCDDNWVRLKDAVDDVGALE